MHRLGCDTEDDDRFIDCQLVFPAVNVQPKVTSSKPAERNCAFPRPTQPDVNICSVAALQVMIQILKDMGITEYEPRVINQMLEFTYSEGSFTPLAVVQLGAQLTSGFLGC